MKYAEVSFNEVGSDWGLVLELNSPEGEEFTPEILQALAEMAGYFNALLGEDKVTVKYMVPFVAE